MARWKLSKPNAKNFGAEKFWRRSDGRLGIAVYPIERYGQKSDQVVLYEFSPEGFELDQSFNYWGRGWGDKKAKQLMKLIGNKDWKEAFSIFHSRKFLG